MLSRAMERENYLQAAGLLWDHISSISLPHSSHLLCPSNHCSLPCVPSCSSLTLLPAALQLMSPCKQPINHPCTCISLALGDREFIPLAQQSERPPAARSDQRALNSWRGLWGLHVKAPVPSRLASLPNFTSTVFGACLHPGHGNCLGKISQHELIAMVFNKGMRLGALVREQRGRRSLQEGVGGWDPHALGGGCLHGGDFPAPWRVLQPPDQETASSDSVLL